MLESVVNGIYDLRDVKNQVAQIKAQMDTNISYEQYFTLVLSAAQMYDAKYITKANLRGNKRSIYNSELRYHILDPMEYNRNDKYNIHSSISQLAINNINTNYST